MGGLCQGERRGEIERSLEKENLRGVKRVVFGGKELRVLGQNGGTQHKGKNWS